MKENNPKAKKKMSRAKIRQAAVIDIGSHSIRLIIGEKHDNEVKILELVKNPLLLGADTFQNNIISASTIAATVAILRKYQAILATYQVSLIRVIATTAVREAQNRDIFLDTIKRETDFKIEVLTVGDVVFYIDSFLYYNLQDRYPIHDRNLLIAELGAGTVDFSIMEKGYVQMSVGLPFGSMRLARIENSLEGDAEEKALGLQEYISNEFRSLQRYMPQMELDDVILISEDLATALHAVFPDRKRDPAFFEVTAEETDELVNICDENSSDRLVHTYNMPIELAEMLGLLARTVQGFFHTFDKDRVFVIETSLYNALLVNILFGYGLPRKKKILEHFIAIARVICRKFNADMDHVNKVADVARSLFNGLRDRLGLSKNDLKYLLLAAYFHDLGKSISNRAHHKHSQYIINNLNLFRLNESEVNLVANIARYHRKAVPAERHLPYRSQTLKQQLRTQKLAALLRIADALDRSHNQKIGKLTFDTNNADVINIVAVTEDPLPLERMAFNSKKTLLEDVTGARIKLTVKNKWT